MYNKEMGYALGIFCGCDSWAVVKIDSIMNSAKHQEISAQNLVLSARRFRLDHIDKNQNF